MIHLDTSLLVDLYQETTRDRPGPAFEALESLHEGEILAVSVHVLCELRAGAEFWHRSLAEHEALDRLISGLLVVYPDERFGAVYGRAYAATRRSGRKIPPMDLLIATAALIDDAPLITRNVKDFSRVPGLRVIKY